jgi:transposase
MSRVVIGVDPHKKSVTIEAVDEHAQVLATGRFGTDTTGYRLMLRYVRQQWPHRRWAVQGAGGVGRPLAQRRLADGETVVDVPAKLAARVRVFDTGNARKTDAVDAHAVAMVAVRRRLNRLGHDEELVALRLLADRRDELAQRRVQTAVKHRTGYTGCSPSWSPAGPNATARRCRRGSCSPPCVPGPWWVRRCGGWPPNRLRTWSRSTPSSEPSRRSFARPRRTAART